MVLLCTMFVVGLTSCDKEEKGESIIGTWYAKDGDFYTEITLSSNGNFVIFEEDSYGADAYNGDYTYSDNRLTLFYDDDDEVTIIDVIFMSSDKILLESITDRGENITLRRK